MQRPSLGDKSSRTPHVGSPFMRARRQRQVIPTNVNSKYDVRSVNGAGGDGGGGVTPKVVNYHRYYSRM